MSQIPYCGNCVAYEVCIDTLKRGDGACKSVQAEIDAACNDCEIKKQRNRFAKQLSEIEEQAAAPKMAAESIKLPGLGMFRKWLHDNGIEYRNSECIHHFLTTPLPDAPSEANKGEGKWVS